MSHTSELCIFGLGRSRALAEQMAECLQVRLAEHEERDFEDGEHKARPLTAVRGRDVYVVHSRTGMTRTASTTNSANCCSFSAPCGTPAPPG